MGLHLGIEHDESNDLSAYEGVKVSDSRTGGSKVFYSGDPIADWFRAVIFALGSDNPFIMYSSSLTHFLNDVPGFRTIDTALGELIVGDANDRDLSPRERDWTKGLGAGFIPTDIGSDGWVKGWSKDSRHIWRAGEAGTDRYYRSADLVGGVYTNHAWHASIEDAVAHD